MIGRLVGGRYRLIAPLGEGGMATLWRAVDEQLDREVAVKLLRPQYTRDAGFAARFKQEARSAGSLSHPNIVSVYDYGTDADDDAQYIVMQLVEGQDLATLLHERGNLSVDDAVRVAIGVASALEAAHRRGIVHRDVKPGNILITDDGEVKVTDFGIARAVSEASMTVTGTTLGSVHYFSPEQARGDEVTGASDVYALGIVLYEMLTGRRPFEADSAAGVALKRLNEEPVPTTTYRPDLPAGLVAIVMRAMQRDPELRYPDAGAFAEALRAWQRDPSLFPGAAAGVGLAAASAAAAAAAAAPVPPRGEPTVYVPPRVTRPSDRAAVAPSSPGYRRPVAAREPQREGQPWWIWLLALLGLILLGAIGFLAAQIFLTGGAGPSASPSAQTFAMPDWTNKTLAEARLEAGQRDLSIAEPPTEAASDTIEKGRIISTDPAANSPVAKGDTVRVTVSSGPDQVPVPPLLGQTQDQAQTTLQQAGLRLGTVRSDFSDEPEGRVINTVPAVGTPVEPDSSVDIIVSKGPEPTPTPSPTPTPTLEPTPTPVPATPAPTATPVPATPTPTPAPGG
jgi:serine/threonine-protein kinase